MLIPSAKVQKKSQPPNKMNENIHKIIKNILRGFNRLFLWRSLNNRVFLNLATTYPTNRMASEMKQYFEANNEALEVLVAVGKKMVSVDRDFIASRNYFKLFRKMVEQ